MLYPILRPILFSLPPEKAHELTLTLAALSPTVGRLSGTPPAPSLAVKVGSLAWKSPVGLAAGLDKNAEASAFFAEQGFGALECGTITLKPQIGNPRPRLFRYPKEHSLRNAMGFPNEGLIHIAPRLKAFDHAVCIGANIGKNKDSSSEESIDELSTIMATLDDDVDYFVVNVSSPNTPGLRAFQEKSYLSELFKELQSVSQKDLYLKIAPDLDENKIIELTRLAADLKLSGLIATNTTIMPERGIGGVSGELLTEKARRVRQLILNQQAPIELIGVGGISNFEDVKNFWRDGGKVVQVYTAYVYQGPELLKSLNQGMENFLKDHQIKTMNDFLGLTLSDRQRILN